MSEKQLGPAAARMARLWHAADVRRVPLRTIITAVLVVAMFYLAGKLIYRLRDVVLIVLVAGFVAVILNPLVLILQRSVVKRRGFAVTLVTLLAVLVFLGLAVAFGYPLVNAITNLANKLPAYVASAQSGRGWIGHLTTKYHVQHWVSQNAPKLVTYAQDLSKPALSIGKGAFSLLIELFTIFVLVLILLLEGPRLRKGLLGLLSPAHAAEVSRMASEVNRSVVGYMLGNILTSVICGLVVFVTLFTLNVPFPQLWAIWVALVDFLPMIGGALAGIPTVLFALAAEGLTAGIVTGVVFVIYTQFENHVLNPVIMSKTVRISPLLVLISVLVGASIGSWVGGLFGGFVAALLSIPAAGALQVIVREAWQATGPPIREVSEEELASAGELSAEVPPEDEPPEEPEDEPGAEAERPAAGPSPDPREDSVDRVSITRPPG